MNSSVRIFINEDYKVSQTMKNENKTKGDMKRK
jgi:hypothetical protein